MTPHSFCSRFGSPYAATAALTLLAKGASLVLFRFALFSAPADAD
jgi:hypothetical protein